MIQNYIYNIFVSIMTDVVRVQQLVDIQAEAHALFEKKNQDYGDAFLEYGTVGILVRIGDKIKRAQSITKKGIHLVNDEKLRDTLIDLHNYAAMGIMIIDDSDELVLESNDEKNVVMSNSWRFEGDNGIYYTCEYILDKDNMEMLSCSCPSFKFSQFTPSTCKHIKNKRNRYY